MPFPQATEFRYLTTPVSTRAADDGAGHVLTGHPAVFGVDTAIGPPDDPFWLEQVSPGAFRNAIAHDDVRALFNHDENWVLGRNRAGTLRLSEDATGLACEIMLPDTSQANDLLKMIERRDVTQMSFAFSVRPGGQVWEDLPDGRVRRTLRDLQLFDVSPVSFAAYPTTDVAIKEARAAGLLSNPDAMRRAAAEAVERANQYARNRLALAARG
jgi:HK97 family phage prohead protease